MELNLDIEIRKIVKKVYEKNGYLCDPHGACGFESLNEFINDAQLGVFLETAHPAKFTETVESIIGHGFLKLPEKLAKFMNGDKMSIGLKKDFHTFKNFLVLN